MRTKTKKPKPTKPKLAPRFVFVDQYHIRDTVIRIMFSKVFPHELSVKDRYGNHQGTIEEWRGASSLWAALVFAAGVDAGCSRAKAHDLSVADVEKILKKSIG